MKRHAVLFPFILLLGLIASLITGQVIGTDQAFHLCHNIMAPVLAGTFGVTVMVRFAIFKYGIKAGRRTKPSKR